MTSKLHGTRGTGSIRWRTSTATSNAPLSTALSLGSALRKRTACSGGTRSDANQAGCYPYWFSCSGSAPAAMSSSTISVWLLMEAAWRGVFLRQGSLLREPRAPRCAMCEVRTRERSAHSTKRRFRSADAPHRDARTWRPRAAPWSCAATIAAHAPVLAPASKGQLPVRACKVHIHRLK